MNKKVFLMTLVIAALAFVPCLSFANGLGKSLSVASSNGSISGTLSVEMGSHTNTFTNFSDLTVVENDDNTIDIVIKNLQIGSMPGKISVDASSVPLDGVFSTYSEVVTFKFIGTSYYDAKIKASKTSEGKITFRLETVDAKYLGVSFTANIEFTED